MWWANGAFTRTEPIASLLDLRRRIRNDRGSPLIATFRPEPQARPLLDDHNVDYKRRSEDVEGAMLDQARSRRLLMPSRSAQGRWAWHPSLTAVKPIWWRFIGTGFLALGLAGGVAAVSGEGGSELTRQASAGAAQSAAPQSAAAPASANPRPAPVSAVPSPAPVQRTAQSTPPASVALLTSPSQPVASAPLKPKSDVTGMTPSPGAPEGQGTPATNGDPHSGAKAQPTNEPTKKGTVSASADAPTACLPGALRTALADVANRFGPVTVVSTQHLNTRNHASGSARHKLHEACKAVDFRVDPQSAAEVKAYLRARPGIGGVESYRDGVVHIDADESRTVARSWPRPATSAE